MLAPELADLSTVDFDLSLTGGRALRGSQITSEIWKNYCSL